MTRSVKIVATHGVLHIVGGVLLLLHESTQPAASQLIVGLGLAALVIGKLALGLAFLLSRLGPIDDAFEAGFRVGARTARRAARRRRSSDDGPWTHLRVV